MDLYIGMIIPVAFNFTPQYFLPCDGRLLPIQQYAALYSLLGIAYGGDGTQNFGLPDLRGRFPLGETYNYSGTDRFRVTMGKYGGGVVNNFQTGSGSGSATISVTNLPSHTHNATFTPVTTPVVPPAVTINVSKDGATSSAPLASGYIGAAAASGPNQPHIYAAAAATGTSALNAGSTTVTAGSGGLVGGTVNVANVGAPGNTTAPVILTSLTVTPVPYQAVQFLICVEGAYPMRN